MSGRLAATDTPGALLADLLSQTIRLIRAERGLLVSASGGELRVLDARTAAGEPVPASDRAFDDELVQAALRQQRTIALNGPMPVVAAPLPGAAACLLLQRRFHRGAAFGEEALHVVKAAADPLALALRLER
jgi:hypothetical protein